MTGMKWIKIDTGIFNDSKIRIIKSMPEGNTIVVIWLQLLALAGREFPNGVFVINDKVACTDEMLATIFGEKVATVRFALKTFEDLGMVEICDGAVTLPNWNKYQSVEKFESQNEKAKERMRRYRERKRLSEVKPEKEASNEKCYVTVTSRYAIEEEEEEEKEKEKKKDKYKPSRHRYGEYKNVLLTDTDMEKLKAEFPDDWEKRIERLSAYMASTGKSYKNHLATIRNWARMQKERDEKSRAAEVKQFAGNEDEEWKKQDDELHELMKERGWI